MHKRFRIYSIAFAAFVLIAMLSIAGALGDSHFEDGKVTSFYSEADSDTGYVRKAFIQLESGKQVRVSIPPRVIIKKDSEVVIRVKKTYMFGTMDYQFSVVKNSKK